MSADDTGEAHIRSCSHSSLEAEAASDDDQFRSQSPVAAVILTPEQQERAEAKLKMWTERLLKKNGVDRPLPSKFSRALRILTAQKHNALLQLMFRFSQMDGSEVRPTPGTESIDAAEEVSSSTQRELQSPSDEDRTAMDDELVFQFFSIVAKELEGDWNDLCQSCSTCDAKDISFADKNLSGVDGVSLVYGEVSFVSFAVILARHWRNVAPGKGKIIDIGSGSGRGVFAALLLHDFESIVGVEILRGLVKSSKDILEFYHQEFRETLKVNDETRREVDLKLNGSAATTSVDALSASSPSSSSSASSPLSTIHPDPSITLLHADFRDLDWSDADIVFVNSTCFDEDLMADLSKFSERLKKDALLITTTKRIQSKQFRLISDDTYEMSWGFCTVNVQRKIQPPLWESIEKIVIDDVVELDKVMPDLPAHLTSKHKYKEVVKQQASEAAGTTQ